VPRVLACRDASVRYVRPIRADVKHDHFNDATNAHLSTVITPAHSPTSRRCRRRRCLRRTASHLVGVGGAAAAAAEPRQQPAAASAGRGRSAAARREDRVTFSWEREWGGARGGGGGRRGGDVGIEAMGAGSVGCDRIRPRWSAELTRRAVSIAVTETRLFITSSELAHHSADADPPLHLLALGCPSQVVDGAAVLNQKTNTRGAQKKHMLEGKVSERGQSDDADTAELRRPEGSSRNRRWF